MFFFSYSYQILGLVFQMQMQDGPQATHTQHCVKETILQVIPLHSTISPDCVAELETHVRSMLNISDCIQCHALMTVSYSRFKRTCLQKMKGTGGKNDMNDKKGKQSEFAEVAFGRGYFARLTPDNIVLVYKTPRFGLPIQPTNQRHIEMDSDN